MLRIHTKEALDAVLTTVAGPTVSSGPAPLALTSPPPLMSLSLPNNLAGLPSGNEDFMRFARKFYYHLERNEARKVYGGTWLRHLR